MRGHWGFFLLDDYAEGEDTGIIEQTNLTNMVENAERYIGRTIRTLVLARKEYDHLRPMLKKRPLLPLWMSQLVSQQQVGAAQDTDPRRPAASPSV